MTKIKMRHPTMRFNFTPPGEVFETTPECVDYLISEYGCEVVEEVHVRSPITQEPATEEASATIIVSDATDVDWSQAIAEPDFIKPIETSPGWYKWEGKKYRKSKLPSWALDLLEE